MLNYVWFFHRGTFVLFFSLDCICWVRPYRTLSPDVHITWTFVKASGLCFKTRLFNLWNEQSTKASYFLGSFQKLCWTTRIIVWSESCACRRVFSAGSSWIMVAVREREGCGLTPALCVGAGQTQTAAIAHVEISPADKRTSEARWRTMNASAQIN